MKKKTLAMLLSAALCVSLFAGCSGGTASTPATETAPAAAETTPAEEEPAELTGTVNTDGSTSMADVMAAFQDLPHVRIAPDLIDLRTFLGV